MIKAWLSAFRLRTLPLALSSIITGSFLAASQEKFNALIFTLAVLTTIFLQILSNLANDYGDTQHGADNENRVGPTRAMQSGAIEKSQMKIAIGIFTSLALVSGLWLVYLGTKNLDLNYTIIFIVLGLAAIGAAIKYTAGKNPYGYLGLGDIFVFLFFGWVGVAGSYFLFVPEFNSNILLIGSAIGLLSTSVLNMNNMRDCVNDEAVGKNTLVVKIGFKNAKIYHAFLVLMPHILALAFVTNSESLWSFLFLITLPIHVVNLRKVFKCQEPQSLDSELKKLALSTLLFSILFGLGQIL